MGAAATVARGVDEGAQLGGDVSEPEGLVVVDGVAAQSSVARARRPSRPLRAVLGRSWHGCGDQQPTGAGDAGERLLAVAQRRVALAAAAGGESEEAIDDTPWSSAAIPSNTPRPS